MADPKGLAPQQPVKVVALVGESPTRRIGRFTTEQPGACRPARRARGVSSPGIEPMGLNEDEPQLMSLVKTYNRSRRVPGAWTKADAGSADNRQPLPSPAGSAWQARREGQPQIKRGESAPMSQGQIQGSIRRASRFVRSGGGCRSRSRSPA